MEDTKPWLSPDDFETTSLRHSSRKIGDYAYRVTLFDGKVLPGVVSFGEIHVNSTSPIVPLNITNMGIKPLPIKSIVVVGDFLFTSDCPVEGTLAKGASCQMSVQFAPQRQGPCTGGVYIDTGDSMGSEFTKLEGVGIVDDPTISITDALVVSNTVGG